MGFFTDTKFDSIYDMADCIDEVVGRNVRDTMHQCNANDLGLDIRAGYCLYVNEDCIAVEGDGYLLDYYGGFEYVDKECVRVVGDWKFYFAEDSRVREHIEIYFQERNEIEETE